MNEFEVDENDTRMALSYVVQVRFGELWNTFSMGKNV